MEVAGHLFKRAVKTLMEQEEEEKYDEAEAPSTIAVIAYAKDYTCYK